MTLAELLRAERERCAKVCRDIAAAFSRSNVISETYAQAAADCEREILALPALPADGVCVPREPTEDMLAPGEALLQGFLEAADNEADPFATVAAIYQAMLAAAPGEGK